MYREKISQSIEKVYQAGVAAKILQYMNKIRNEFDITQARRWVMELLQNARDLAWEGKPLQVQIELKEDALIFRHSGQPFKVKDILSIVNQVSSKNPGEGVGQFGTGFMSTYQLSERVEIHSILKEEGFPGKEFRVTLDRTGRDKEEILRAIFYNLEQLQEADELPDVPECGPEAGCSTEFRYMLENRLSRETARTGVADLADTILYVMLFSERIGSVELSVEGEGKRETVTYRRGKSVSRSELLEELTVAEERQQGERTDHTLFFMREQGLTLAAEYDPERGFLPISERTPRIFVDFPLIGAERFPFPVVINNLEFSPNEPRSGISLVDNPNSAEAVKNKALMELAVKAYGVFLGELLRIDTRGAANLISTFEWQENKEWSESWVKEKLYRDVYEIIRRLPIFPTIHGNMSLSEEELHLIRCESPEENSRLRKLIAPLRGYTVPEDGTDWYGVLQPYQIPDGKVIRLEKLLQEASELMGTALDEEAVTAMEWNRMLYDAAMKDPDMAMEIQAGSTAIFPNQCPDDRKAHRLFTARQICRDPDIPEIFKDIAETLQDLDYPGGAARTTLRQILLPREFGEVDGSIIRQYELTKLTEYIQSHCSRGYRVSNFNFYRAHYESTWQRAWDLMLSCGPDSGMYELYSVWYRRELPERKKIEDDRFSEHLWRTTYCSVLESTVNSIAAYTELRDLGIDPPYRWLGGFYGKCSHYLRETGLVCCTIFPDQEGHFRRLTDLSRDRVQEEELKEIAACFRDKAPDCDIYKELLDRRVTLDGWNVPWKDDKDVAMRINNAVQMLLMECSLSQAELVYQEACTRLLGWIEEHPHQAQEYFPFFYNEEDRMKLLTPKAAASMQKKARSCARLMDILGAGDPEEAERLVRRLQQKGMGNDTFYHAEADMWLDDELMALGKAERDEACRKIGTAGEEYAFELVCQELIKQGYQVTDKKEGALRLTGENEEYTVFRPDTCGYHQAGWDIRVTSRALPDDHAPEKVWYIEVKTHTPGSVRRGILQISNRQMELAADCGDNYIVISVVYNYRSGQVEGANVYRNLFRRLAEGKLVNLSEGYSFRENEPGILQ